MASEALQRHRDRKYEQRGLRAEAVLLDATYAALSRARREIDDAEDRAIIDGEDLKTKLEMFGKR